MARRFATAINLNGLELQNARIQNLAVAPGSAVLGQIYFDTALVKLRICTNATGPVFTDLAAAGVGSVTSSDILDGTIVNADINGSAAIAYGKLNLAGAILNADLAGSIAYSKLSLTGAILNADLAGSIAYSKLSLTGAILNADLAGSIAYSKLSLTGAILNADLAGSIANTKLATDPLARANHTGTQLAATVSNFDTQVRTSTLAQMAAPAGSVSMNSQLLTNVLAPVSATDAANKAYVDATAQGLEVKDSVRAATTANIVTLAGGAPNTLDGVTLAANDRILVKDQTTTAQNGIYTVATLGTGVNGTWSRSGDADTSVEVNSGMFSFVSEGTVNADSGWVLTTNNPITLNTTGLVYAQFSGAGSFVDGAGLVKTGNTLDVVGTAARITANANSIDIAATYVGQATITTLGTITTGVWSGTDVALTDGGTGASSAAAARTNLVVAGRYSNAATHGAGTTITITAATHGLGAGRDKIVQVIEESSGDLIDCGINVAANGDVVVSADVSQSANTLRVTVLGF